MAGGAESCDRGASVVLILEAATGRDGSTGPPNETREAVTT